MRRVKAICPLICLMILCGVLLGCASSDNTADDDEVVDDDEVIDDDAMADDDTDANDDDQHPAIGGAVSAELPELWLTGITYENDAWVGFFVHFQDGRWTYVEPPVPMEYLDALSVREANHGLAADYQHLLRYDGEQWSVDETLPTTWGDLWIYQVLSTAEEDWVFAANDDDLLIWLRWRNGEWTGGLFPGAGTHRGFDTVNEIYGDVRVAVWDSDYLADSIWRFDRAADAWVIEHPVSIAIMDLAFGGPDTGVALGAEIDPPLWYNALLRYDQTGWHASEEFPDMGGFRSAAYRDADHLAVVTAQYNYSGYLFQGTEWWERAGALWSQTAFLEGVAIEQIRAQDERSIWAVGNEIIDGADTGGGVVYRWDDTGFHRHFVSGVPYDAYLFTNVGIIPPN